MKLYYSPGACSLAVRITLEEIGANYTSEAVNLKTKKTENGDDFLKINSKGAVPTLVLDNNEVLTENATLQQYLAETFDATHLLPAPSEFKRYRVLEWLSYISSDLHKGCGPLFNGDVPEEDKDKIFRPLLKKKFDYVNERMGENKYLTDDQFTIADSYLFVILSWFRALKLDINDWKNLSRYYTDLKKRPSIQKALNDEKIER